MTPLSNNSPGVPAHRTPHKGDGFSDVRKIIRLIVKHWYLFLIFVPLGLGVGWLQYKLSQPVYRASVTMLFKVNSERSIPQSVITEGFGLSPEMRVLENQTFIIRSHAMVLRAVDRLDFAVSYFSKGNFIDTELYNPTPFVVKFDSTHPQLLNTPIYFDFSPDGRIKLSVKNEGALLHNFDSGRNTGYAEQFSYETYIEVGQKLEHHAFSFELNPAVNGRFPESGKYYVIFNSHASVASKLRSSLGVSPYRDGSSIIFLSANGHQPQKLVRFLNVFSEEIIKDNLERKNDMASRSIDFIQRQLVQVSDTLKITQQKLMDFRRNNRFMMPSEVSQRLSMEFFEKEKESRMLDVSYDYLSSVRQRLMENSLDENDYMLPAFSSEPASIVQQFVVEHLNLIKEYHLVEGVAGASNPYKTEIAQKIELSRRSLMASIQKQMESIQMQRVEIDRHVAQLSSRVGDLPELERDFLALERTHKLNDAIYTFLLQKNSEMQIAKASNVPDNEVLDQATFSGPVSPVRRSLFSRGLIAGLLIPALIIAILELFNTRVRSRDDITGVFREVPIVGEILRNKENEENVVLNKSESIIAESFRSLRTKLKFLLAQNPGKVISVTSTNTGEGKTFCAINLASVFAISGKKTLLVGFDLRKPRLSVLFNRSNQHGISNYLIGQVGFEDIVQATDQKDLFLISAGMIPPNPSELISSSKTAELFVKMREHFDVIVIDTPPVGLVSDARLLMDMADCHLYVVRAGVTNKEHLNISLSNLLSENIACLGLVMNDVHEAANAYGYYGSGYFSH